MTTTTITTALEYSTMPQQNYEFECTGCWTIKSIVDYSTNSLLGTWYCTDCMTGTGI